MTHKHRYALIPVKHGYISNPLLHVPDKVAALGVYIHKDGQFGIVIFLYHIVQNQFQL